MQILYIYIRQYKYILERKNVIDNVQFIRNHKEQIMKLINLFHSQYYHQKLMFEVSDITALF